MAKFDWYKRNPAKFFSGTVGMAWEVKAVYGLVLDLIYDAQGRLVDDGPRIVHYLGVGMSLQRWKRIRDELVQRGKLVLVDGFLTNDRATRDIAADAPLQKTHAIISGDSLVAARQTPEIIGQKNGKQIAPVSDFATNGNNELNLAPDPKSQDLPARARENQSQNQKTTTRLVDVVVEVERIAEALGQKRGKYWATDYGRMIDDGLTFEDVMAAARAHSGGEIKSLNALRGLARKKRDDRMAGGGRDTPANPAAEAMTAMQWSPYLALFLKQGVWDEDRFGPPPSRGGCRVPLELLKAVITAWAKQGGAPREERDLSGNVVAYPSSQPDPQRRAMWEPKP